MDSKVVVIADETTGAVVNVSENNPEYGFVKVQQVKSIIDENGFLRRKPISALIPGLVADLKSMNLRPNQEISGRIVIEESLAPFNEKTPERDLKVAGETGIVCRVGGMPIYRRTKFSFNSNAEDTLIKHDNVEELRAAYDATQKPASAVRANEDFNIGG